MVSQAFQISNLEGVLVFEKRRPYLNSQCIVCSLSQGTDHWATLTKIVRWPTKTHQQAPLLPNMTLPSNLLLNSCLWQWPLLWSTALSSFSSLKVQPCVRRRTISSLDWRCLIFLRGWSTYRSSLLSAFRAILWDISFRWPTASQPFWLPIKSWP